MAAVFLSVLCVLCLLSFRPASCKVVERRLQGVRDWQVIDMWDFGTGNVGFIYNITFPLRYSPMNFLFYDKNQFKEALEGTSTCGEKVAVLQFSGGGEQVLTLDVGMTQAGCMKRFDFTMGDVVNCNGRITFDAQSGMMWYVVANKCGSSMDAFFYIENIEDRERDTTRFPSFPPYSGQSKATFTTLTLIPFLVLRQCLA